jgi:hypothetical protein
MCFKCVIAAFVMDGPIMEKCLCRESDRSQVGNKARTQDITTANNILAYLYLRHHHPIITHTLQPPQTHTKPFRNFSAFSIFSPHTKATIDILRLGKQTSPSSIAQKRKEKKKNWQFHSM